MAIHHMGKDLLEIGFPPPIAHICASLVAASLVVRTGLPLWPSPPSFASFIVSSPVNPFPPIHESRVFEEFVPKWAESMQSY
jgi:hypothetical protein